MKLPNYKISSFLFILFLFSCGSPQKEEEPAAKEETEHHEETGMVSITPEQYEVAGITLGTLESKSLSATIKVNGLLDLPPKNLVSISTPLDGIVKSTEMLQGMRVKKGTVVATIQNTEFIQMQQDYLDYKSQLDFLKQELARQEELSKENVNSKKAVQKARSEFNSISARLLGQKTRLSLLNINFPSLERGNISRTFNLYAPISGYVTQVNTNTGAFASTTDMLFKIADTEHLHAELTVFEKDVPKLRIGQKVKFTLANEESERMATVFLIGREISKERTIQIHCHLDKEDSQLIPGMYLKAYVESGSNKVSALPEEAIVEFEGKKYVFVQLKKEAKDKSYEFKMKEVQVGISENGYTQVSLADQENDNIVIKGAYDLLSKIKNAEEEEGH
jgi:cobalt-zinc-cadmium efflux system membrane fusion protein